MQYCLLAIMNESYSLSGNDSSYYCGYYECGDDYENDDYPESEGYG
ncbi:hypothetical protein [Methanobrevibacter sp.]